jgi:hypothetical protein
MISLFLSLYLFFPALSLPASLHEGDTDFDSDPVFLLTEGEMQSLQALIQDNETVGKRYDSLLAAADEAVDSQPSPTDTLHYEGLVGTHPDRQRTIKHLMDMKKLRALTWAYRLSGKPEYLQTTRDYLMAWTSTLKPSGNPINDNKLVSIIFAHYLLKDALNTKERKQVENWMRRLAEAEMASEPHSPHGNWHAKRIKLVAFVGSALEEEKYLDYAAQKFKENVIASLYPDGSSTDFEQRDALHYHVSGLDPMLEIALALRQSRDLYGWESAEGASLKKSVHFVVPYAMGEKTHAEWVNTKVKLDKERWASGDEFYRPGKPWSPQTSQDMFQFASLFDPALKKVVNHLSPEAKLSSWTEVLVYVLMNN